MITEKDINDLVEAIDDIAYYRAEHVEYVDDPRVRVKQLRMKILQIEEDHG